MSGHAGYRLTAVNAASQEGAGDLARLHGELLSHSPVALLGPAFMRDFYYTELPRMGLISATVAYVDGEPAGFIVVTADSSGFMQQAVRARFFNLVWVMLRSLIVSPTRVLAVWEALQIMRGLPPADSPGDSGPVGEILSFGVLPKFRTRDFMMKRKLRVSQDLLRSALAQFEASGVLKARVIVDADNREARLFYTGNGWIPGMDVVPGWRKKTVEFLWTRERK